MLRKIKKKILSNEYGGELELHHFLTSKVFDVKIKIISFSMPNKTYLS